MSVEEAREGSTPPPRQRLEVPTHPPRFRQRVPTPPLPPLWRWGFPLLLLAAAVWSAFLVLEGFDRVLDSEEGEVVEVVTDPTAPGFEAFVEQTWSMLVATEDLDGELVQVAVVAASDRGGSGGTVLLLPAELPVAVEGGSNGCADLPCALATHHRAGGLAGVAELIDEHGLYGVER